MKRRVVLEVIWDAENLYGSLTTSAQCPRRDVIRCVRAGLATSVGTVRLVGEDGLPVAPERWREGFVLTAAGRMAL